MYDSPKPKSVVTKEKTKLLAVGATAPDWELKDLEGNLQTLAQYHGKIVVLDFWATWCGSLRGSYAANTKVA